MPAERQVRTKVAAGGFLMRGGGLSGHKAVGTLYLVMAVLAGLIGGGLALPLRIGADTDASWGRMAIDHGALMVLFCALPALVGGFGSWFVPLLLGAPDMAFRRLNLACWAGVALSFGLVVAGVSTAAAMVLWCVAMLGLAINIVATALNMRGRTVALGAMPLFVWAQVLTAMMMVIVLPVLAAALTRGLLAGAGFDIVVRAMHAFSGPEVGLLLLPAAGVICQLVETFSGVGLRLRETALGAMVVLSVGGASVWVHDVFATGLMAQPDARPLIEQAVMALPMLVLLVAWGRTIMAGRPVFRVPMLWAVAFMAMLVAAPLQVLADGGAGAHALVLPAALFAAFGGFYYWIGKMAGGAYPEWMGRLHVALAVGGSVLSVLPGGVMAGVAMQGLSMLAFVAVLAVALLGRRRVSGNYWGAGARTLEWTLPSPAPRDSFAGFMVGRAGA
ncbi:cbb3-type cytochrome c oxidase subunit I [Gluconacetobacter dulcium]|uniref:Cytochrome-c oxidase n=1 Tax=Gluconacetobacter dulcium TaxID=2729096 RepID=A0A7W4K3G6_9PROT|nr:cbb3-type cytochrome c oxidase subunit I [Gluconacetobacter dulcium]MBB2199696.1 cytochrome-c oxidase [Gluconacetobacter dulcium]